MLEKTTEIETNGNKYKLVFNLNVMEEIQDKYETMNKWSDLISEEEPNIKALKFGIGAMINEGIDIDNELNEEKNPFLTDKQIGRIITELGATNILNRVQKTIVESTVTEETKNV